MLVSILLGGSLGLFAASGLILNVLVMFTIVRGRFLAPEGNIVYPMAFNLLISDSVHLALLLIYLVPAAILQSDLYPGLGDIFGFLMLWVLFVSYVTIDLLAISRFVQVCYPKFCWLLERRKVIGIIMIIWLVCCILAVAEEFLMPCCRIILYYKTYSLHFEAGVNATNYSDLFIEKPISIGTTLTVIFCYTMIFFKMRTGRMRVENSLSENEQQLRRRNEVGFALQTIAIALCATITWISFIIYPLIIPLDQPEWFALVALGMILNSSISALIYVRFNRDLGNALMQIVFKKKTTTNTTVVWSVPHQRE